MLNTIKLGLEKETIAAELQLHSDQGLQYSSQAYVNLTKEYGMTPSMSRRGNCYDNAMAENFLSILKTECIYRHKLNTFDEAKGLIDKGVDFYNNQAHSNKNEPDTPIKTASGFVIFTYSLH